MPQIEGGAPSSWRVRNCGVCGHDQFQLLWQLPCYPFTELFGLFDELTPTQSTELIYCERCSHVQLSQVTNPEFLYSKENYVFSGAAPKHLRESGFLSKFIQRNLRNGKSRLSLEFGANNLVLSNLLLAFSKRVIACDPLLSSSSEVDGLVKHAIPVDKFLSLDSTSVFDLVVARHTLEHLEDIRDLMIKLMGRITDDGIIVFEVPSLDCMISKLRFDAITHQHLHYFTLGSFLSLAKESDLVVQDAITNHSGSNGGSLLVALRKSHDKGTELESEADLSYQAKTPETVKAQIQRFESFMDLTSAEVQGIVDRDNVFSDNSVVGFGASLLLPTLNYHLKGAIEHLDYVLDDDAQKDNLSYRNLRVRVKAPTHEQDFRGKTVLVTSYENSRAITSRLINFPSMKLICPFIL